ncbi:3-carboxymuconate cyclase-like protein [Caballeronia novacaledonica]|uniref:3-carboxymuconate cyclase-like protein n=1 Tax=Caballeronia novacaledonica TaxID=1544861 RepID=A0A2U3I3U5_9BURK|nr:beta-propeller fold lactonase family protein [Caballeronia novacaledonica]SPB14816.1 3-carboxymuconate cyclase-like protein [Caballeronia novacaledonica]
MTGKVFLYSAVDNVLTQYQVDVASGVLERRCSIQVPAKIQYAWPHPSRQYLYVTTSNGGPRVKSDYNHVSAFAIGPDGALTQHGNPQPLDRRAVHMCVDPTGQFILNAHNHPMSGITVHSINADGTIGKAVEQPHSLDYGIYPHQVMTFPSGDAALIVDRGNKPQSDKPEDPGALRSFKMRNGVLDVGNVAAPWGGYGFGPRHVDFHPSKPWLYASDERMNRLYMFRIIDGRIEQEPAYTRETLADSKSVAARQIAGPIHVHPSGRYVYVANRADHTIERDGQKVFAGGENNIAVYVLDQDTGEPQLMQHADTHSFHVRTFACDPSGSLLVTASIKALSVEVGTGLKEVPAALSVFRIGADGSLDFMQKYDVETSGNELQYWMGIVSAK